MKMFENLSGGVVTVIPTPRFMKELTYYHSENLRDIALPVSEQDHWENFVEFYRPEFSSLFYHFDSWEELAQMVRLPRERLDRWRVSNASVSFAKRHKAEQLEKWKILLRDVGVKIVYNEIKIEGGEAADLAAIEAEALANLQMIEPLSRDHGRNGNGNANGNANHMTTNQLSHIQHLINSNNEAEAA
jgi:hypothetical protein